MIIVLIYITIILFYNEHILIYFIKYKFQSEYHKFLIFFSYIKKKDWSTLLNILNFPIYYI